MIQEYTTVCGIEVHTELLTDTKIFCACSTRFGAQPNTQCCPVCTGMPGTLPVLNEKVAELAVRTGLALGCEVERHPQFDRKNYFYPDLPKAYQISQLYLPICRGGSVELDSGKRIRIKELHMEEDAGKLFHRDGKTLINYNRCGVPLLEIVSEADIRTPGEAAEYVRKLRDILRFCAVSDCKMQEGSLRADINVSVMPAGSSTFGTRTEMKNINSFKAIENAVAHESARQIQVLQSGGAVVQETRRWDDRKNTSYAMRRKEEAAHYKYFPEPDLPALTISDDYIERVRQTLPELPAAKKQRYITEYGLTAYDADLLCSDLAFVRLFEKTAALTDRPKECANWIMGEVMRLLSATQTLPEDMSLCAEDLAEVIILVQQNRINRSTAKDVLERVYFDGVNPAQYVKQNALELQQDVSALRAACEAAVTANPKAVAEYRSGKQKAIGFLIGQVMQALGGKADAAAVRQLLTEILQ